jgi:hypothetical protein
METHAALEAGEADPHSEDVLLTPSKKRDFVPPEEPGETHRPRAPRKPNGQVCIRNIFRIYSESIRTNISKYNIAEIKRIWKLEHTGAKCAVHKGKKHSSE